MNLKLFLATVVLLSSAWSHNAKADDLSETSRLLLEGLATLEDSSDLDAFFKKYGNSINSEIITWTVDDKKTPTGRNLYSFVYILCSKALNAMKQCDSPQLIVEEAHTTRFMILQPASVKFVDQDGFIYSPPAIPDTDKSISPKFTVNTMDITLISTLAKLRINNDPSLEKFFNKTNALPRGLLIDVERVKESALSIGYKMTDLFRVNDMLSNTSCTLRILKFYSDNSKAAEYTSQPEDHDICYSDGHTPVLIGY